MIIFLVCRGQTILRITVLPLVIAALVLAISYAEELRKPQVGLNAQLPALGYELLGDTSLYSLNTTLDQTQLLSELANEELDYLVTTTPLDPVQTNYDVTQIGTITPALIVSFFSETEKISQDEVERLYQHFPDKLLIAKSLAVPGFFWEDWDVTYFATDEVITRVHQDKELVGIIPIQDRVPKVRPVEYEGIFPSASTVLDGRYPLQQNLYLIERMPTRRNRLKQWFTQNFHHQLQLDTANNPYYNPLGVEKKLTAVGDVMLDREVKLAAFEHGWPYLFAQVADHLTKADLAFANLESPIGSRGRFLNMFQAPPEAIESLVYAGFDVVSLANNHSLDYDNEGLFETIEILKEHGIRQVGAGKNILEARSPVIINIDNEVRVGFLAYTETWFCYTREPHNWAATDLLPGVAPAEPGMVIEDVARLQTEADVIVVSFHWGIEYESLPNATQQMLAYAAIDAGADIILGHHPHVLQGIEFYNKGVIAYSLGNFVFDLPDPKTWHSLILDFTLSPDGIRDMTINPAFIQGVQPRLLTDSAKQHGLNYVRQLSSQLLRD